MRSRARFNVAVLLGAATSVLVAWGIAWSKGEKIVAKSATICVVKPDSLLTLNETRAPGRRFRMIWYLDSIDAKTGQAERARKQQHWKEARAAGDAHAWPDSWLRWGDLERAHAQLVRRRQSAFGFPVPCVWYERSGGVSMFGSAMRLHGGYEISKALDSKRSGFVAEAALAYRPIWAGLVMNTLVYGSVWMGVMWIVEWSRRRRRPNGACRNCGYDIKGLPEGAVCPECGAKLWSAACRPRGEEEGIRTRRIRSLSRWPRARRQTPPRRSLARAPLPC
jgi:hypothetical protein